MNEQQTSDPLCDKCGAPITTGLMALLCPGREECALWPSEGVAHDFSEMIADTWTAEEKQRFREHCAARAEVGKTGAPE